ncbi:MAG: hypothetical protein E4H36_07040 [Spirochaetales bacterium]|nr:MAG: hypothetical protein E4H36_07040 [Spirochaetales bacterium]
MSCLHGTRREEPVPAEIPVREIEQPPVREPEQAAPVPAEQPPDPPEIGREEPEAPQITEPVAAVQQETEKPEEPAETAVSKAETAPERPAEPDTTPDSRQTEAVQKPQPVVLGKKAIIMAIMSHSTETNALVYHKTGPLLHFIDVDKNGLLDAGAIFIKKEKNGADPLPQPLDLTDMSRLYNDRAMPFDFYYQLFIQRDGKLYPDRVVSLGKRVVIQGIIEIKIKPEPDSITALSAVFPTPEGTENEWILFSSAGISRISFKENLSNYPRVYDIDEDGTLDIIQFSKIFEEGIGMETFITLYKWNRDSFKEFKTINVVRNLNQFLQKAIDLLTQNNLKAFFIHSLSPSDELRYAQGSLKDEALFHSLFKPLSEEPVNEDPLDIRDMQIYDVTFPEILENPFLQTSLTDYVFRPLIRITASSGSYFFKTAIKMAKNPFTSKKQFYFLLQ